MPYITNNGKGFYIQHELGKRRSDGTLRPFAWNGQEWCTITARYWQNESEAVQALKEIKMPYIKQEIRKFFEEGLKELSKVEIDWSCGDLNYVITQICCTYLKKKGEKYQTYNDIIGVLECAKMEMYRRKVSIYEDGKIVSNGDAYGN